MEKEIYNPLSDMARIKDSLASLFSDTENITRLVMPVLDDSDFTWEENWYGGETEKTNAGITKIIDLVGHCFTTPYIEGTVTDNRCAIFIETSLPCVPNKHLKEVLVEISVICHKGSVNISNEDKDYYNSIGIYGNRVDCICQAINSAVLSPNINKAISKKYAIGVMALSERNPIRLYVPASKFYGKIMTYTYQSFYQTSENVKR